MMGKTQLKRVIEFATKAHAGQKRKYTGEDYITHPLAVGKAIALYEFEIKSCKKQVIAAAYLHDVLEDTSITYGELRRFLFSVFLPYDAHFVFDMVVELTDVYTKKDYPYLNRLERKRLERKRLETINPYSKLIKMEDIAHNSISIEKYDPEFFKVFLSETKEMWLEFREQVQTFVN